MLPSSLRYAAKEVQVKAFTDLHNTALSAGFQVSEQYIFNLIESSIDTEDAVDTIRAYISDQDDAANNDN